MPRPLDWFYSAVDSVGGFLAKLRQVAAVPMALLLTDSERLAERFARPDATQRVEDWRRLCATAGIPPNWAIEFELRHPSPSDHARLAGLLGADRR